MWSRLDRIQSRDPNTAIAPKAFTLLKNATGSATAIGDVLCFDTAATTDDGIRVVQPAAGNLSAFAGIATEVVANGEMVLVQTKGKCDKTSVIGHASLSAGAALVPTSGHSYFSYSAAGAGAPAFAIFTGTSYTNTTTTALRPVILYGI